MDPDSSSKDNANPTVLEASALPTRRPRKQQHIRHNDTNDGNEDEGYDTGKDDMLGKSDRRRRRRRIGRGDGGGGGTSRNRLRNGKGNTKVNANAFFDGLLEGASLAERRGYMDEILDDSADEDEDEDEDEEDGGIEDGLDNDNVDIDIDVADDDEEEIDEQEIYDLIAPISDPEHPLSLGSLAVVNLPDIKISSSPSSHPSSPHLTKATVLLTPTITHCSLATVIGLAVRVRLEQSLPPRFRVSVRIKPGTHTSAAAVSKQLADKERVAAALENGALRGVLRKMMATCG